MPEEIKTIEGLYKHIPGKKDTIEEEETGEMPKFSPQQSKGTPFKLRGGTGKIDSYAAFQRKGLISPAQQNGNDDELEAAEGTGGETKAVKEQKKKHQEEGFKTESVKTNKNIRSTVMALDDSPTDDSTTSTDTWENKSRGDIKTKGPKRKVKVKDPSRQAKHLKKGKHRTKAQKKRRIKDKTFANLSKRGQRKRG
jgi:hypothetical protein